MFRALGLDELQARLYHELLGMPTATEAGLATTIGRPLPEVRAGLAVLQGLGLVSRDALHPDQVCAAPPDLGLGSLLAERRAALAEAERVIPALTSRYHSVVGGRGGGEVIDVVHGTEAVVHRIALLRRGARRELLSLVPPPGGPATIDGG
ncbi:MAG: hypothetical protein M3Y71_06885, partial [Actinomycetota bacterium]|nr:hypothetical protein [Actinomycetota bacterium]